MSRNVFSSGNENWLGARRAFALAQLELRGLRIAAALKRFNPSQPRVPAGNPNGGQWTSEGGLGGAPRAQPVSWRPRSGSSNTRIIRGRAYEVTPAQEARLDVSAARARALVREVQRHDPSWRPRPSIYEGVEGEILANEAQAMHAMARLRELGVREPAARPLEDVLLPAGRAIGRREKRAPANTRTVTPAEFHELLEGLSPGVQVIPSPSGYPGVWYRRPDGSIFGIRRSQQHGITFDVIEHQHSIIRNGYKVHQK